MTDRPLVHCPCCGKIHRARVALPTRVADAYDVLEQSITEFTELIKNLEEGEDPEDSPK